MKKSIPSRFLCIMLLFALISVILPPCRAEAKSIIVPEITWLDSSYVYQWSESTYNDGYIVVKQKDSSGTDKYGLVDTTTGKLVIPCIYDSLYPPAEGLVCAEMGRNFGFLDLYGNAIIPFIYAVANDFSNGYAAVRKSENNPYWMYTMIDKNGQEWSHGEYQVFADGYCYTMYSNGLVELYDIKNNKKTSFKADYTSIINNRLGTVDLEDSIICCCRNGKWGAINWNGEIILPFEYDSSLRIWGWGGLTNGPIKYECGVFRVGKDLDDDNKTDTMAIVDRSGKLLVPFGKYYCIYEFNELGYARVESKDGKFGVINSCGKEIVPCSVGGDVLSPDNPLTSIGLIAVSSTTATDGYSTVTYYDESCTAHSDPFASLRGGETMSELFFIGGDYFVRQFYSDLLPKDQNMPWVSASQSIYRYIEFYDKSVSAVTEPLYASIYGTEIIDGYILIGRYNYKQQVLEYGLLKDPALTAPTEIIDYTPVTAAPSAQSVTVNGKIVAFDVYNINGNNYFKLRDLAATLSGSEKQFEVGWDGAKNAISLTSGKAYTPVGGEMASKGSGNQSGTPTSSAIYKDGSAVTFTAYNIGGNNYFKLRDIGAAFGFGVDYDSATNTVVIDTSKGYTAA